MTKKLLFSIVLIFSIMSVSKAQNAFQLAIGVDGGTYGGGLTLATSLSSNFKLRAGLDFLDYKYKGEYDLDPQGYVLDAQASGLSLKGALFDPALTFVNGKLIIDYYPMKNGIFSISTGLYAGSNSISVNGRINDYTDPNVVFELGDAIVRPNIDGNFEGKLNIGNAIKPYFGLGLGRTIANHRVGFKLDLGLIYQGDYSFEKSKNIEILDKGVSDRIDKLSKEIDVPAWLLKCWPMISLSLSYRIF